MDVWGSGDERADRSDTRLVMEAVERRRDDHAAAERVEVEWAATSWRALVAGALGESVDLDLTTGATVAGRCIDAGRGWCLIDCGTRYTVVILDHVVALTGAVRVSPETPVQRGVGAVLRRWARMREPVSVELTNGNRVVGWVSEVMNDAVCVVSDSEPAHRVVIPLSATVAVSGSVLDSD